MTWFKVIPGAKHFARGMSTFTGVISSRIVFGGSPQQLKRMRSLWSRMITPQLHVTDLALLQAHCLVCTFKIIKQLLFILYLFIVFYRLAWTDFSRDLITRISTDFPSFCEIDLRKKNSEKYFFYLRYQIPIKLVANNITTTTFILYNCSGESLLSPDKFAFKINSVYGKETTKRYLLPKYKLNNRCLRYMDINCFIVEKCVTRYAAFLPALRTTEGMLFRYVNNRATNLEFSLALTESQSQLSYRLTASWSSSSHLQKRSLLWWLIHAIGLLRFYQIPEFRLLSSKNLRFIRLELESLVQPGLQWFNQICFSRNLNLNLKPRKPCLILQTRVTKHSEKPGQTRLFLQLLHPLFVARTYV